MSTGFRVTGRGVRLTERKLEALAKGTGGYVARPSVDVLEWKDKRIVYVGKLGCVWHYRVGGGDCWNAGEVYAQHANQRAFETWLDLLIEHGYAPLTEHDEGFF